MIYNSNGWQFTMLIVFMVITLLLMWLAVTGNNIPREGMYLEYPK